MFNSPGARSRSRLSSLWKSIGSAIYYNRGNVGIGTNRPQALLQVNGTNVSITPSIGAAATFIHLIGADNTNPAVQIEGHGNIAPEFWARASAGTSANPTATSLNQYLFLLVGQGFNGTSYGSFGVTGFRATQNWSVGSNGTRFVVQTVQNGTATSVQTFAVDHDGSMLVGGVDGTGAGLGSATLKPVAFSSLTAASTTVEGAIACVSDSTTTTWGATITGGSSNVVLAFCDGTNWTVAGK